MIARFVFTGDVTGQWQPEIDQVQAHFFMIPHAGI